MKHVNQIKQLLSFFNKHAYHKDYKTYLSEIDNEGKVISNKVYNVALSRLIYGLSYASNFDSTYLNKAKNAYTFQLTHLSSEDSSGLYFNSYYNIKNKTKDSSDMLDIWQQAYGLCGLTELYKHNPKKELLSVIHQFHTDFTKRFHDSIYGGFYGKYNLKRGQISGSKSLQSIMYPITAYMENLWLTDTINRVQYEPFLKENLIIAYNHCWNDSLAWVNIKFDDMWNPCNHTSSLNPYFTVAPGHNFQLASLFLRTNKWHFLSIAEKDKYQQLGIEILKKTLNKKIFPASDLSQGFYSEVNPVTNKILDDRKTWWQHCEALIALSLAGDTFNKQLIELEQFYFNTFIDKQFGGEYFYLNKDNTPLKKELKGSIGKSAYHSIEMIKFLNEN